jgi:hypothetical protein
MGQKRERRWSCVMRGYFIFFLKFSDRHGVKVTDGMGYRLPTRERLLLTSSEREYLLEQ